MDRIIIERNIWIDAPRERVWQAVTELEQIAAWFAPGMAFKQQDNVISIEVEGAFIDVAVVVVFDPPRQIATQGLPDRTITTTYTLEEENGGTRFTVTETGLEALPEAERDERTLQDTNGWEMALENLKAYIDGRELPRPEGF